VHQFAGEENLLNKTTAPKITGNSQSHEFFLLYFQTILAVKRPTDICNKYTSKNEPDIAYSSK
jgi:hypothetical protein